MVLKINQWLALPFFAAALWLLFGSGASMPPSAAAGGALALVTVGMWATRFAPEHLVALLFFLTAMIFGVADSTVVFSGFGAGAMWLLFGGMILGGAVGRTGLGARLAHGMARRFSLSYTGLLSGIVAVAMMLSFLMPSATGRAVLLMPVAVSLAQSFGFEAGSNGRYGITVAAAMAAVMLGFGILPANVPNLVMIGAAEQVYGMQFAYADYLLLHFPVLSLLKAVLIVVIVRLLFPANLSGALPAEVTGQPMSAAEKRLSIVLAGALLLWATDFWHGVSPAWVALGAGLLCFAPPRPLIEAEKIDEIIQIKPLLFIAGVLSLGSLVVATGFGDQLVRGFLAVADIQRGENALNFLTITAASIGMAVIGTSPTVPAVWTPLAADLSVASGIPLESVIMLQAVAFSTIILPYQTPPMVVALQLGGLLNWAGLKSVLWLAAATVFILLPLDYLWWEALGRFDG